MDPLRSHTEAKRRFERVYSTFAWSSTAVGLPALARGPFGLEDVQLPAIVFGDAFGSGLAQ